MSSELIGLHHDRSGYLFDANENCIGKTYDKTHAKIIAEAFERYRNTRAAPEVPELVRYRMDVDIDILHPIVEPDGEYVRHDQAAAMIDDLSRLLNDKQSQIDHLEDKLAQIKAQEPVGQNCIISVQKHLSDAGYKIPLKHIDDAIAKHYAAPVDQTAEIERLREALKFYADKSKWDSGGFEHGLSDDGGHNVLTLVMSDIDKDRGDTARAALSGKEPS